MPRPISGSWKRERGCFGVGHFGGVFPYPQNVDFVWKKNYPPTPSKRVAKICDPTYPRICVGPWLVSMGTLKKGGETRNCRGLDLAQTCASTTHTQSREETVTFWGFLPATFWAGHQPIHHRDLHDAMELDEDGWYHWIEHIWIGRKQLERTTLTPSKKRSRLQQNTSIFILQRWKASKCRRCRFFVDYKVLWYSGDKAKKKRPLHILVREISTSLSFLHMDHTCFVDTIPFSRFKGAWEMYL